MCICIKILLCFILMDSGDFKTLIRRVKLPVSVVLSMCLYICVLSIMVALSSKVIAGIPGSNTARNTDIFLFRDWPVTRPGESHWVCIPVCDRVQQ
jgi:hypothetical protein